MALTPSHSLRRAFTIAWTMSSFGPSRGCEVPPKGESRMPASACEDEAICLRIVDRAGPARWLGLLLVYLGLMIILSTQRPRLMYGALPGAGLFEALFGGLVIWSGALLLVSREWTISRHDQRIHLATRLICLKRVRSWPLSDYSGVAWSPRREQASNGEQPARARAFLVGADGRELILITSKHDESAEDHAARVAAFLGWQVAPRGTAGVPSAGPLTTP